MKQRPAELRNWVGIGVAAMIGGCCAPLPAKTAGEVAVEAAQPEPEPDAGPVEVGPLAWIHDDYPAALAAAREQGVPLVIDMWAHWCHTCLSMQHFVLADPSMATYADRFVWLALDTDRPENAAVLARFPVEAWPTFYVVSPTDESVQAVYLGSASLTQFRELLDAGERGHRESDGTLAPGDPLYLVRQGDRRGVKEDWAGAERAYAAALEAAPADWPRRPDVLVARMRALASADRFTDCADLGLAAMGQTGASASAADFTFYATYCGFKLGEGDPRIKQLHEATVARLRLLTADGEASLAVDDRSDALRMMRESLDALGNKDEARAVAERQLELLTRAAKDAPGPAAAATYNWPRAEVHVYLDRGAELIPALEQSARDLRKDFDPPYRSAWVLLKIGRLDEALAAAKRSLALVYGPRKGTVLWLIADIHEARGDGETERVAREMVVEHYEALPEGHRDPLVLQRAREALEAVAK